MLLSKQDLIDFEEDISKSFSNKEIKAPVHLNNGDEDSLIEVFTKYNISSDDWVLSTWRSHYVSLLKGVPRERLKSDIIKGKSISLCYPEYNIFSSAIVAGSISISVGTAAGLKRQGKSGRVFCFLGDMAAETGTFMECYNHSVRFDLPIVFVIGDNNKSVCTPTRKVCYSDKYNVTYPELAGGFKDGKIHYYKFESKYPHSGIGGQRIVF